MTNEQWFLILAGFALCIRFGWVLREWKYDSDKDNFKEKYKNLDKL